MLNKRNRYTKICEINIIPLLDVLLVLLVMFMITSPIVTQHFEIYLPRSSHLQSTNERSILEIIIEILGNDRYNMFINHKKIKNISFDQIFSEIHLKNNIKITDATFFIAAPHDISYNEVIKILNFLYRTGVSKINILTNPI